MKRFVLLLLVLVACGKRGDPHPPVPVIPQATTDLVVAQRGPKLILSWSYPALTTSGQKLADIRRVVVYRYVEELQASQPARDTKTLLPGDIDPTVPVAVALFAKIPPLSEKQFLKVRERLESIEGKDLPDATVGAKLTYEDTPQFRTTDGRPVRISYAVVTEGTAARSEGSNVVTIVPVEVAMPPAGVTATAKAEGIVVTWSAPQTAITGTEKPRIAGYNVFRYPAGQELEELASPVSVSLVSQTTFTDVPAYGGYTYRVTAVSAVGPPRLESDPSEPATATFKDLMPPPAPTGFAALVEPKAVRLVWEIVDVPDLAGYRIYRIEGTGEQHKFVGRLLFTPQMLHETNWRDTLADPGIYYYYEVTAVDKNGNESAPAKTDWVFVPKTP